MRSINICILLQAVLNFITANGNHQQLLYSSPKTMEGSSVTVQNCRVLLALCISKYIGVKNVVALEDDKSLTSKGASRRALSFAPEGGDCRAAWLRGTLLLVLLVSIQYLPDNAWIIQRGGISHAARLLSDYFPQQPSHDLPRAGFRKPLHHLQRENQSCIRAWLLLKPQGKVAELS